MNIMYNQIVFWSSMLPVGVSNQKEHEGGFLNYSCFSIPDLCNGCLCSLCEYSLNYTPKNCTTFYR